MSGRAAMAPGSETPAEKVRVRRKRRSPESAGRAGGRRRAGRGKKAAVPPQRALRGRRTRLRTRGYRRLQRRAPVGLLAAGEAADSAAEGTRADRGAIAEARYDGGERIYERLLPPDTMLPDVTLEEIVAAGIEAYRPKLVRLMGAEEVRLELEKALAERQPLSVIRLGDGELLTLAQDCVISGSEVAAAGRYLPYAGVDPPDLAARDLLAEAVRRADIVGVPVSRRPHFQPLLVDVMRTHGIDLRSKRLTVSTINYRLYDAGMLTGLMQGRRLLAVGNAAAGMAAALEAAGFSVAGVVSPVSGMADMNRVMEEIARIDFELALVAAGIPAVVLAVRIASELGRSAIDFGHMANEIADGRAQFG